MSKNKTSIKHQVKKNFLWYQASMANFSSVQGCYTRSSFSSEKCIVQMNSETSKHATYTNPLFCAAKLLIIHMLKVSWNLHYLELQWYMKFSSVPLIKIEQGQNGTRSSTLCNWIFQFLSISYFPSHCPVNAFTHHFNILSSNYHYLLHFYIINDWTTLAFQQEPHIFSQSFRIEIYFQNKKPLPPASQLPIAKWV